MPEYSHSVPLRKFADLACEPIGPLVPQPEGFIWTAGHDIGGLRITRVAVRTHPNPSRLRAGRTDE